MLVLKKHILSLSLTFCSSQLLCDSSLFKNNSFISDIISEGIVMVFLVTRFKQIMFCLQYVFTLTFALSIFQLCYERKTSVICFILFSPGKKYKNINFWWNFLNYTVWFNSESTKIDIYI